MPVISTVIATDDAPLGDAPVPDLKGNHHHHHNNNRFMKTGQNKENVFFQRSGVQSDL